MGSLSDRASSPPGPNLAATRAPHLSPPGTSGRSLCEIWNLQKLQWDEGSPRLLPGRLAEIKLGLLLSISLGLSLVFSTGTLPNFFFGGEG